MFTRPPSFSPAKAEDPNRTLHHKGFSSLCRNDPVYLADHWKREKRISDVKHEIDVRLHGWVQVQPVAYHDTLSRAVLYFNFSPPPGAVIQHFLYFWKTFSFKKR